MTSQEEKLDQYIDAINAGRKTPLDSSDPELNDLYKVADRLQVLREPAWPSESFASEIASNLAAQLKTTSTGHHVPFAGVQGVDTGVANPWVGEDKPSTLEAFPAEKSTLRKLAHVTGALAAFTVFALVLILVFREVEDGSSLPGFAPPDDPQVAQLAFTGVIDGNNEIFLVNADGNDLQNLTSHPASDWSPTWSEDGSQIAFTSDRSGRNQVYVMSSDGSNVRQLTDDGQSHVALGWSPDGNHIAYMQFDPDDAAISLLHVMQANGANQRRLTAGQDLYASVDWHPDSSALSTMMDMNGQVTPVLIDIQNSDIRAAVPSDPDVGGSVAWSSDGRWLAYISNPQQLDAPGEFTAYEPEIRVLDLGDGTIHDFDDEITIQAYPDWSPDSSSFAFTGEVGGLFGLYTGAPAEAGLERIVTSDEGAIIAPAWSPDGSQIVFIQMVEDADLESGVHLSLQVVNGDGTGLTTLSTDISTSDIVAPAWRPTPSSKPVEATATFGPPTESISTSIPEQTLSVPSSWLGVGETEIEGARGSFGWIDGDNEAYASVSSPFIDVSAHELDALQGAELQVRLPADVSQPDTISISIYTWTDNNALPEGPDGSVADTTWFMPSVAPVSEYGLTVNDLRFTVPQTEGHYVVQVEIHWPDDERVPDNGQFPIFVTYAFMVKISEPESSATPVIIEGLPDLTPTVQSNEIPQISVDQAIEIVRAYVNDPDARLTATLDDGLHPWNQVWVYHSVDGFSYASEYRIDRSSGVIVEAVIPLNTSGVAPEDPIPEEQARAIAEIFASAHVTNLDELTEVENTLPEYAEMGAGEAGDLLRTFSWTRRDNDSGVWLPTHIIVKVNLRTGLIFSWHVQDDAYDGPVVPEISAIEAIALAARTAVEDMDMTDVLISDTRLMVSWVDLPKGESETEHPVELRLVWGLLFETVQDGISGTSNFMVDAITGEVLEPKVHSSE